MLTLLDTGPISYMKVLGQPLVILSDPDIALKLLEKRSGKYWSRPVSNFADMSGWSRILGALIKPEDIRLTRKFLHQEIGTKGSFSSFDDIQRSEVSRLLLRLLKEPDELQGIIRKEAGAITLKIAYGYNIEPHSRDPLVDLAETAINEFSLALVPTSWLVDFVPILKYLPVWFPGAGFIKTARQFKVNSTAFTDIPYNFVKQQMKTDSFMPSFLSNCLQRNPVAPGSKEEIILKWAAADLYAGGSDTTVSSMSSFFLAMALFPEAQRKAQEEIDSVIGSHRLPQAHERESLPYMNALVKEVLRWHPVLPVNIAHALVQDDECEGYFIPKGSFVLANIWTFTHDPDVYDEPMTFKPDRFLESSNGHKPAPDPHRYVFGFGRRACPGRVLADGNIFLSVAQILAVYNISKHIVDGKVQDIQPNFTGGGVISHPAPYKVSVSPRSQKHQELIESLEELYPWEKSDAALLPSM
ncbi:uncharacterized protein N7483_006959 [Penicillium malachiteum]|uniref:uncharacterized protein n=1 Tax=Penicillium malachiteum TaxID=1324776 RepID=UPI0025470026|nr:uncharacterized protein N7483_006959 [Penicillium malachiteum]KAJ5725602.1 hypothetical protein N7483_006959 [Penicillium malachiteum]